MRFFSVVFKHCDRLKRRRGKEKYYVKISSYQNNEMTGSLKIDITPAYPNEVSIRCTTSIDVGFIFIDRSSENLTRNAAMV